MTENDLLRAILDDRPQPVQPDEITMVMLIDAGMSQGAARGKIARMLQAGEITGRKAINPDTGKMIIAYRLIDK